MYFLCWFNLQGQCKLYIDYALHAVYDTLGLIEPALIK